MEAKMKSQVFFLSAVVASSCMARKTDHRSTSLTAINAAESTSALLKQNPISDTDFVLKSTLNQTPLADTGFFFSSVNRAYYANTAPSDLPSSAQSRLQTLDMSTYTLSALADIPTDSKAGFTFHPQGITGSQQIFGFRTNATSSDLHFAILDNQTDPTSQAQTITSIADAAADGSWLPGGLPPTCHSTDSECYVVETNSTDWRIRSLSTTDLSSIRTASLAGKPLFFGLPSSDSFVIAMPSNSLSNSTDIQFINIESGKVSRTVTVPSTLINPNMTFFDSSDGFMFVYTESTTDKAWYAVDLNAGAMVGKIPFTGSSNNRGIFAVDDSGQWLEARTDGSTTTIYGVDASKILNPPPPSP